MKIRCPDCDVPLVRESQTFRCPRCQMRLRIEETAMDELKSRLRELKMRFGEFSLRDIKSFLYDQKHPVTDLLIRFSAWGIQSFARWPVFMAVVVGLSWLFGPWGLMMLVVLPIVYRLHRDAIEKEAQRLSEEQKKPDP